MAHETPPPVSIGDVDVGPGLPPLLIAEIGLNHNGSVELAHEHIDAAALSGAAMVKFQKRSPADLATAAFLDAPFPKCPLFGRTQRAVRERLELSIEELGELKAHAHDLGLLFSMSVFDLPSLAVAEKLDLEAIKVASHSITNAPLLDAVAATGRPLIASLGGASWEERDAAVERLQDSPLVLLHCVSAYPCPDTLVRLDTMDEMRRRYGRPVGYSGHEEGVDISVAAAVLGAVAIERHFTLNRSMVGLDHILSLEPDEFAALADRVRRCGRARGTVPGLMPEESAARTNYHVSVCTARALPEGHTVQADDLVCKQPAGDTATFFRGLDRDLVIGRTVQRALPADVPIPRDALTS